MVDKEKTKEFAMALRNANIQLSIFIKLFNMWVDLNSSERKECINKLYLEKEQNK